MKAFKTTLLAALIMAAFDMAAAERLRLPDGMGGVSDIGAIPCNVFTDMLVIGPLGTRHSLLTWANGYYYATTRKTLDEIIAAAKANGQTWDFERLTDHFADYCAENPDAHTRDAVTSLGSKLLPGA